MPADRQPDPAAAQDRVTFGLNPTPINTSREAAWWMFWNACLVTVRRI